MLHSGDLKMMLPPQLKMIRRKIVPSMKTRMIWNLPSLAKTSPRSKPFLPNWLPGPFANYQVALLHGRMEQGEKQRVMDEFSAGRIDVLVSTTVIEVGINVPNATVMTILGAERFGLAQLHQLRGRSQPGGVCRAT